MEKAFSILGHMELDMRTMPVVGVLFIPEAACNGVLKNGQLGMKTLKGLGFASAGILEAVTPLAKADAHAVPTLYYFVNAPSPSCIYIEKLTSAARRNGGAELVSGDPLALIPAVSGSVWQRFIKRDDKTIVNRPGPPAPKPRRVITR